MATGLRAVWRERPVTVAGIGMVAAWMLWLSGVLFLTSTRPVTVVFAHGPGIILPAHTWGIIFLVTGLVKLLEIFILRWKRLAVAIQFATLIPLFFWAVSWMLGPATPGQPAYTFVLGVSVAIPFVSELINSHIRAKADRVVQEALNVDDQIRQHQVSEHTNAPASSTTEVSPRTIGKLA